MTRTFVVGTAGHVDHGKSSLVRALTGTDPDRLAEEQLRQMTIDLGFADLVTPSGNHVHLIDVPGHERFVRNMLAGAGGIDAAMLTVAADDGPMPQTREHLAILDLLGISHGVVALTKADLVDIEWRDYVAESVRELLIGSTLEVSDILPVSSISGAGLPELQLALDRALSKVTHGGEDGIPRLPIDRVFSMSGFGTVVTGTLLGGPMRVGDRIEVLPQGLTTRIRGLQSFGEAAATARPGSRVAVNLSGMETQDLARGDVLTRPGAMVPTMRIDASARMLGSIERPFQHNDEVIVFTGSSETPAKAALLDREKIEPGEGGWIQLRMTRPVAVMPGDRFILRRPSPAETIGGGCVVELDPPRHKRFQPAVSERLQHLSTGDPGDRLLAWLGNRLVPESETLSQPIDLLQTLETTNRIAWIGTSGARVLARPDTLESVMARLGAEVDNWHRMHPLEPGAPREVLRQALGFERSTFDAVVAATADRGEIEEADAVVRRPDFRIMLDPDQRLRADAYLTMLRECGFQPPLPGEAGIEPALVAALVAQGLVTSLGEGIYFLPERVEDAQARLMNALEREGSISLAEYRDLIGATRKFAQALLEYFDRLRVTRRVGDRRVAMRTSQQREGDSQT